MDTLSRDELRTLVEKAGGQHVSIFMPVYRKGGADPRQNEIMLRNLLHQAQEQLVEGGMALPEARKLLQPAHVLLEDDRFWQGQGDGLAVFISPSLFRYYRVSAPLEELMLVSDHFHAEPLMPFLGRGERFYILALSLNEVRLFEATRHSASAVGLPKDVPKSLEDALKYDDFEQEKQYYSGTPGWGGGKPGAVFYGQGVGSDIEKGSILRYFQRVDTGLHRLLREERAPMVLAGVDYLLPIYKEASKYRYIIEEGVVGNPDHKSAKELHEQAWAIVQPYFDKARQEALDHYMQFVGTGETSEDIKEIVPAAYYGQIDTLFVVDGVRQWGTFDPQTRLVVLHEKTQPGDEDLMDFAATQTLLNSGVVYVVEPGTIPDEASLAATLRY